MGKLPYLLILLLLINSCAQKPMEDPIINGVSIVASPKELSQENVVPVLKINANYASVMPFGFIKSIDHPEIIYDTERQWFGETMEGLRQYIGKLHENNIDIMIKPQIWIWRGEFTGSLSMKTEEDWKSLEDSYSIFILDFAKLAQEENVSLFCIGTELEQFIVNRPDYWNALIVEIKKVYKGRLTYAANWDEYKRVPFWKQLDYIGVDAYFPISDSNTPTIEMAMAGWKPWKSEMQEVAKLHNKKVLFTEYGYRSVDYAGKEPWKSDREMINVNLDAQTNLTEALFAENWNEEWFAGGFIWKWFIDHSEAGGVENNQFTPQNKPVEEAVMEVYGLHNK